MKETLIILLGVFLMFGMTTTSIPVAFSQEEENLSTKEVTGEVISVNSEKSAVVIKYLADEETQTYRTAVFSLHNATEVEKKGEMIDVFVLKKGDVVTLRYRTDDEGMNIVDFILVEP